MALKTTFDFEINDWLEFHKHYLKNSKETQRNKLILTVVFPLIWVSILAFKTYSGNFNPIEFCVVITISTLWIIFYPKRYINRTLKKGKRMITEGDNSGLIGKQTLQFDNEGIVQTLPESENKTTWKGITKKEETADYYFLYNSSISAIIIPKNKIPNEVAELNIVLKKHLKL